MKETTFTYECLIKEAHLDTFGHVNNATYLEILEEARWDFITKNDYGLHKVLERKKGPVILEVHLKYRKELSLRETIKIISYTEDITTEKIFTIHQDIHKEDGSLAAEAKFTCGFFDLRERKLIRPTEEWKKALGY